jgi:Lrp/AsnC family leucine-responsive transcriptional regulator
LRILRTDPRMTVSELARRVGMSAPAVRERLQRLEEAGVIKGYHVEIDPAALGYPIAIVIRVRPMPGKLSKVAELAESLPQVVECHRITGEDCYFIRAYIEGLDQLDRLQDKFAAYGQTTTSLIQSSPVPPRSLPLPGEPHRER